MLHALFAAAMLFTAYSMKDQMIDQAKVIELVAGEGDNYAATEAPALGTPEGVKFEIPKLPEAPAPTPTPAVAPVVAPPEPTPVQAVTAPPEPTPVEKKPAKPEPSPVTKAEPKKDSKKAEPVVPDIVKNMKRVERRLEAKQKAQRDREAKAAAAAAALQAKQAEIAAKKAALLKAGGGAIKVSKIDAKGIREGVVGGTRDDGKGGAGGTALSREEQDLLETYFALLKQKLRDAHEKPTGLSDQISAEAEFYVGADGSVTRASIVKSSGNSDFDKSVLAAIRDVRGIGPRPDGKGSMLRVRFRMKDEE
jgi:colicin import membrane protein